MTGLCFVDSNVFVYAVDSRDKHKQAVARDLITKLMTERTLVLSTQVLLEFFHAATRKVGYPERDAMAAMDVFAAGDVVVATAELVKSAVEIAVLEQQSVWDSMIISAAALRRCSFLYSEDLGAGRRVRGVQIVNPFIS